MGSSLFHKHCLATISLSATVRHLKIGQFGDWHRCRGNFPRGAVEAMRKRQHRCTFHLHYLPDSKLGFINQLSQRTHRWPLSPSSTHWRTMANSAR